MKSFFLKSLFVIVLMLGLAAGGIAWYAHRPLGIGADRKSTRLNSSHANI